MKVKIDPRKVKPLPDWAKQDLDLAAEFNQNGMPEEARELIIKVKQALRFKGVDD